MKNLTLETITDLSLDYHKETKINTTTNKSNNQTEIFKNKLSPINNQNNNLVSFHKNNSSKNSKNIKITENDNSHLRNFYQNTKIKKKLYLNLFYTDIDIKNSRLDDFVNNKKKCEELENISKNSINYSSNYFTNQNSIKNETVLNDVNDIMEKIEKMKTKSTFHKLTIMDSRMNSQQKKVNTFLNFLFQNIFFCLNE